MKRLFLTIRRLSVYGWAAGTALWAAPVVGYAESGEIPLHEVSCQIVTEDGETGRPRRCTATAIGPNRLLTAAHCTLPSSTKYHVTCVVPNANSSDDASDGKSPSLRTISSTGRASVHPEGEKNWVTVQRQLARGFLSRDLRESANELAQTDLAVIEFDELALPKGQAFARFAKPAMPEELDSLIQYGDCRTVGFERKAATSISSLRVHKLGKPAHKDGIISGGAAVTEGSSGGGIFCRAPASGEWKLVAVNSIAIRFEDEKKNRITGTPVQPALNALRAQADRNRHSAVAANLIGKHGSALLRLRRLHAAQSGDSKVANRTRKETAEAIAREEDAFFRALGASINAHREAQAIPAQ